MNVFEILDDNLSQQARLAIALLFPSPLHLSYTILWVVLISPFAIFSREAITIHSHRLDDTTLCRRPYENDFSCRDIEFCCRSRNWHSKAIKFAFIVSIVGFAGAAFYRWCLVMLNFCVWNYWRTSKLPSVQMVWWLPKLFHHITRPPAKLSNFLSFRFDLRFRSNPLLGYVVKYCANSFIHY